MTQEEQKKLLLKDLCSRLPYGVKASTKVGGNIKISFIGEDTIIGEDGDSYDISFITPYLFPLGSITIEQEKELSKLGYCEYALHDDTRGLGIMVDEAYLFFEFCYKHHIDFLGLIDMGLAIDATGKNVY